jgi:hypothetical protein
MPRKNRRQGSLSCGDLDGFDGGAVGGRRAAIFYTQITTARLNGFDPHAWLADVIARIADHPISRVDELLPWNSAAARPLPIAA